MTAPDSIHSLVQHFEEQRATFHAEKYPGEYFLHAYKRT